MWGSSDGRLLVLAVLPWLSLNVVARPQFALFNDLFPGMVVAPDGLKRQVSYVLDDFQQHHTADAQKAATNNAGKLNEDVEARKEEVKDAAAIEGDKLNGDAAVTPRMSKENTTDEMNYGVRKKDLDNFVLEKMKEAIVNAQELSTHEIVHRKSLNEAEPIEADVSNDETLELKDVATIIPAINEAGTPRTPEPSTVIAALNEATSESDLNEELREEAMELKRVAMIIANKLNEAARIKAIRWNEPSTMKAEDPIGFNTIAPVESVKGDTTNEANTIMNEAAIKHDSLNELNNVQENKINEVKQVELHDDSINQLNEASKSFKGDTTDRANTTPKEATFKHDNLNESNNVQENKMNEGKQVELKKDTMKNDRLNEADKPLIFNEAPFFKLNLFNRPFRLKSIEWKESTTATVDDLARQVESSELPFMRSEPKVNVEVFDSNKASTLKGEELNENTVRNFDVKAEKKPLAELNPQAIEPKTESERVNDLNKAESNVATTVRSELSTILVEEAESNVATTVRSELSTILVEEAESNKAVNNADSFNVNDSIKRLEALLEEKLKTLNKAGPDFKAVDSNRSNEADVDLKPIIMELVLKEFPSLKEFRAENVPAAKVQEREEAKKNSTNTSWLSKTLKKVWKSLTPPDILGAVLQEMSPITYYETMV